MPTRDTVRNMIHSKMRPCRVSASCAKKRLVPAPRAPPDKGSAPSGATVRCCLGQRHGRHFDIGPWQTSRSGAVLRPLSNSQLFSTTSNRHHPTPSELRLGLRPDAGQPVARLRPWPAALRCASPPAQARVSATKHGTCHDTWIQHDWPRCSGTAPCHQIIQHDRSFSPCTPATHPSPTVRDQASACVRHRRRRPDPDNRQQRSGPEQASKGVPNRPVPRGPDFTLPQCQPALLRAFVFLPDLPLRARSNRFMKLHRFALVNTPTCLRSTIHAAPHQAPRPHKPVPRQFP